MTFPLFPAEASTMAPRVDALMAYVFGIAAFFSTLIASLILFFLIKYHHASGADRTDPPTQHLGLELAWTGIPLVLVLSIFVWGARLFVEERRPPPGAMAIDVVAKQWMWELQHPEGRREIDELHVPVGRPVVLRMISQDVIHSFFVPDFRLKQDVLPGRVTTEWFTATRPGRSRLFCTQYCGTLHSGMIGWVTAMTPADYERWIAGGPAERQSLPPPGPTMEDAGARLFLRLGCVSCHAAGFLGAGPPLEGVYGSRVPLTDGRVVVADESYLRESILRPDAKIVSGYAKRMPSFEGELDERQIEQLIGYLKSLRRKP